VFHYVSERFRVQGFHFAPSWNFCSSTGPKSPPSCVRAKWDGISIVPIYQLYQLALALYIDIKDPTRLVWKFLKGPHTRAALVWNFHKDPYQDQTHMFKSWYLSNTGDVIQDRLRAICYQGKLIHNWVIIGFQQMVHWRMLGVYRIRFSG
jgi:hypothetical protein